MAEVHRGVPLGDYLFQFDFGLVAPEVCEDIWSPDGPMRRRTYSGAELVVNLSASPFRLGFVETVEWRRYRLHGEAFRRLAAEAAGSRPSDAAGSTRE